MYEVKQMDEKIYNRAAKLVRSGLTHPALVVVQRGAEGEAWTVVDVTEKMKSEADKDMVASFINMLAHHPDVAIIAFVSEAWMLVDDKAIAKGVRPSQHLNRKECVVVSFSIGAVKRAITMHMIERDGKHARLVRGELSIETDSEKLEGRFFAERQQTH